VGRKAIIRSCVVVALACCSLPAAVPAAMAQQIDENEGGLTVTPRRGPIGTTVTLRGNGCTSMSFIGGDLEGVTGGFDSLPEIDLDGDGDFRVTYTIPAKLKPYMGLSGGRPKPGTYFFRSYPPRCYATFVVTGLAATGPTRVPLPAIAVLGGLFVLVGAVLRTGVRETS
jgi:hypothetical protein